MAKTDFGDCIGCNQPIRPPYRLFTIQWLEQRPGHDAIIHSWGDVEICSDCAAKLTADDLHRLASAEEAAA